jgi:hypothetical protein
MTHQEVLGLLWVAITEVLEDACSKMPSSETEALQEMLCNYKHDLSVAHSNFEVKLPSIKRIAS